MKEYLLMMGYTEEDITKFVEEGKCKWIDEELVVVDEVLFVEYIVNLINLSINPTIYFEQENDNNSYLYHVYKYLDQKMYRASAHMMEKYNKEHPNCVYSKIFYNGLLKYEDKTEYMVDETKYGDDISIDSLKEKELELLTAIELNEQKEAYNLVKELIDIYKDHQETLPLVIIEALMVECRKMSTNRRKVSKHIKPSVTGDPDSIIMGLLKEQDYYRLETFLKEELESQTKPSIRLEMYSMLVDELMFFNAKNLKYLEECMLIEAESKSLDEVFKYNHLPKLTDEFIQQLLNPKKEEKFDGNHYKLYEEYKNKHDYVKAKEELLEFDKEMKRLGVFKDVDYLVNELNTLIEMKNRLSEEDMSKYESECNEIDSLIKAGKYTEAISKLSVLDANDNYSNPFLSNKIGLCYYSLKNYPKAIEHYSKAKEGYIYAEDIFNLAYSYFKVGKYAKALTFIERYDYYYPEEDTRVYYIQSICQVKLKEFKEAIETLETCEAMNVIYYNMPIEYAREKEIITIMSKGKDIPCYTEDDYVSYALTPEEEKLKEEISSGNTDMGKLIRMGTLKKYNIVEKIEYLLSCAKIYFQLEREDEGKQLCQFIGSLINDPRLDTKEKETFTLRLKNYTTL